MAYYTERELRGRSSTPLQSEAKASLIKSAPSPSGRFDVFLSHSVRDAVTVLGIRNLLTEQGLTVYVDWIDDPQLDRTSVSPATAARLRDRMDQSETLIYATSAAAQHSRWMPWELGYFDGLRNRERISIMPIDDESGRSFPGQEYLGLYKVIHKLYSAGALRPFAMRPSGDEAQPLRSFGKAAAQYVRVV